MSETLALAAVVGIGLFYFLRSKADQKDLKDQKDGEVGKTDPMVDYEPILHEDDPNDAPVSYSRMAIGEKLIEQKFDIGVSNKKWVFMKTPLTGAIANVANVAASITQYRNGQFYWNKTGKAVAWDTYEDRKSIIELLRYGWSDPSEAKDEPVTVAAPVAPVTVAATMPYVHKGLSQQLVDSGFDIKQIGTGWVFTQQPLTGVQARINAVRDAMNYHDGEFLWKRLGKTVRWDEQNDRAKIMSLMQFGTKIGPNTLSHSTLIPGDVNVKSPRLSKPSNEPKRFGPIGPNAHKAANQYTNHNGQVSYSRAAINEKLLEYNIEVGGNDRIENLIEEITQYRNGKFLWNKTGSAVDWTGDRKRIIELLQYGQ